jgi:serine/threonine-protein kinase
MTRATVDRLNTALTGRYRVEQELGQEEMATVFLARDLTHEVQVALKVLNPELATVVGAERFLAEIRVMASLTHPHILSLRDLGEADGFLFYVMPYIEGGTLRDRIDREGQLPVDEAVGIARAVADALDHAHRYWVTHLDIRPDNILLQKGGPVVSDFGIALAVGVAGGDRLAEAGLGLGTPSYMSPEQATGDQPVGRSTDTYALGSVLYEMLVGNPPFAGTTAQAVLGQIIASEPVSAMEKRPSVPANVDGAIRKALEKLPADRFTSAKDFSSALEDEDFRYGETAALSGATAGPWNRLTIATTTLSAGLILTLAVMVSVLTSRPVDRATTDMVRFSVPVGLEADVYLGGDGADFGRPSRRSLAFSPSGDLLVYSAWGEDAQLYLQRLDQERAEPLEGTAGGGRARSFRRTVPGSVSWLEGRRSDSRSLPAGLKQSLRVQR